MRPQRLAIRFARHESGHRQRANRLVIARQTEVIDPIDDPRSGFRFHSRLEIGDEGDRVGNRAKESADDRGSLRMALPIKTFVHCLTHLTVASAGQPDQFEHPGDLSPLGIVPLARNFAQTMYSVGTIHFFLSIT